MNFKYICIYHIERMQICEAEAFRVWSQMMQRGVKAYADCRTEAAHIYLNTALDIALLRSCSEKNVFFTESHFVKPAEFLVQLYLIEDAFDQALAVLAHVAEAGEVGEGLSVVAEDFLAQQYKRVEIAEKVFFGPRQLQSSLDTGGRNCIH